VAAEPFLGGLAEFARAALAEDLGVCGDVTSSAILAPRARATAQLVARAEGVLAGWDAAAAVAATVDPPVQLDRAGCEGQPVVPGQVVGELSGLATGVLAAERTLLNLLGHLSGVATLTRAYVDAIAGTNAVIRDTRKTLPGLRGVQKAAVAAGGGVNHRHRLDDGILVKDNHAALAGGIDAATPAALAAGEAQGVAVQIEVDSPTQLHQALDAGARSVLCDNFALADLAEAVAAAHAGDPPAFVEASGGVTLDAATAIAATGVDAIAVGALTHSAPALDIGLDVQPPS
jgi:nicotinate-nucleotide pyrophosphorylase (carboxylating)